MGATTDSYVVDLRRLPRRRERRSATSRSSRRRYHDDFDAWAADFENPYDDNMGADADRNWSSERRLRGDGGRRRRRRGDLPQHDPAVLPEGARSSSQPPGRHRRRPGQAVGRAAGPQPLAGRLLQPGARAAAPASPRSCCTTSTRRCREIEWAKANGLTGGVLLPGAPPGSGVPPLYAPGLRTDLGGVRGPRHADQPPQRQRRARHGPVPGGPDDVPARGHVVGPPRPLAPHLLGRDGAPPHAAVRLHRAGHGVDPRGAHPPRLLPRPPVRARAAPAARRRRSSAPASSTSCRCRRRSTGARQCHLGSSFIRRHEVGDARRRSASTASCGAATTPTSRAAGRSRASTCAWRSPACPRTRCALMVGRNAADALRLRLGRCSSRSPTEHGPTAGRGRRARSTAEDIPDEALRCPAFAAARFLGA